MSISRVLYIRAWWLGCIMPVCFVSLMTDNSTAQSIAPLRLGANVNGQPLRLEPAMLIESETQWVRAFFPASKFISGVRDVTTDAGFQHLKSLADQGYRVVFTIKWDLREADWFVPAADSVDEQLWLDFVDDIFVEMDGRISIFEAVNELYIDTKNADLLPDPNGEIPMVRLLQKVTARIRSQGYVDPQGAPVPIYVGGYTRLENPSNQNRPSVIAINAWTNADPDVTGICFHMHHNTINEFDQSMTYLRGAVPTKPFIVTEYSLVWRYKNNLDRPVGATQAGVDFLSTYELDPDLLVYEYINLALTDPVPEAQWHAFLNSQTWFDPNFVTATAELMDRYGVAVATYAFTQNASGGGGLITPDTNPWVLNPIFVRLVAVSPDPNRFPRQLGFFDDYVAWNKRIVHVWDGSATPEDSDLSNPLNWLDDVAPFFPQEPKLVFTGTTGLTPNNDDRRRVFGTLIFDSLAGAFDLTGQAFVLTDLLSSTSPNAQTISAPVQSDGAVIQAASGDLLVDALAVSLGMTTTLEVAGTATVLGDQRHTLAINALSGSGDLHCLGSGRIELTGDNAAFTGEITTEPTGAVVIRAWHPNSLGSSLAGTFIDYGGHQALEIAGDMALAEPLTLSGRLGEDDIASAIINVSGNNTLTGLLTLVDGDATSRTGLNFRVDAGQLTVTQAPVLAIDHDIDDQTPDPLVLRVRGAGRLLWQPALVDDDDSADIMGVYVGGASILELDGDLNTYSGTTRIAQNGTLDLDGTIPNTPLIALEALSAVVDATDIGGLMLGASQTLSGDGTVLGDVTAGNGSMLSPGQSAGILAIEGGLTLENGSLLDLEVGEASDRIVVSGPLSGPGTSSGGITIQIGTSIPVFSGVNTRVIQAASIQNLTAADFTTVVQPELSTLIADVDVMVTGTEVQLSFNVTDPPRQVLALTSDGGFDLELYLVQAGIWTYQQKFIVPGTPRGFAQDGVTGEIWTTEVLASGQTIRHDATGAPLEVVGTSGVEYAQRVEFLELDAAGNVYVATQPTVSAANQQIYKYDIAAQSWSTIVPPTDGVNYAFGGNLRDLELVGNRLFVADKDNARIIEFNTATGAFVQIFDDTAIPQVSALTYDPDSDRLYVSCNIDNSSSRADDIKAYGGILGRDGLPPTSEAIVFQTFGDPDEDRNIHGILILDDQVYVGSQGVNGTVDGIYRIDNPGPSATTTLVAAADRREVTVLNAVDVTPPAPYDFDGDGDTDAADALSFLACFSGADVLRPPVGCTLAGFAVADTNGDGDVDMTDLEAFTPNVGD